jgi:hypothetical protein
MMRWLRPENASVSLRSHAGENLTTRVCVLVHPEEDQVASPLLPWYKAGFELLVSIGLQVVIQGHTTCRGAQTARATIQIELIGKDILFTRANGGRGRCVSRHIIDISDPLDTRVEIHESTRFPLVKETQNEMNDVSFQSNMAWSGRRGLESRASSRPGGEKDRWCVTRAKNAFSVQTDRKQEKRAINLQPSTQAPISVVAILRVLSDVGVTRLTHQKLIVLPTPVTIQTSELTGASALQRSHRRVKAPSSLVCVFWRSDRTFLLLFDNRSRLAAVATV